eukprot:scaffold3077_cov162-Amphora_coffeaeformis.AAC.41
MTAFANRNLLVSQHDQNDSRSQDPNPSGCRCHDTMFDIAGVGISRQTKVGICLAFGCIGHDIGAFTYGTGPQRDSRGSIRDHDAQSFCRLESQVRQKGPYTRRCRQANGFGYETDQSVANASDGQDEKDSTFNHDGRYGSLVRDTGEPSHQHRLSSLPASYDVCFVRVVLFDILRSGASRMFGETSRTVQHAEVVRGFPNPCHALVETTARIHQT